VSRLNKKLLTNNIKSTILKEVKLETQTVATNLTIMLKIYWIRIGLIQNMNPMAAKTINIMENL
jgi:hypothetical protein